MANKLYYAPETDAVFAASGGTVVLTLTSLANGAGRVSALWDRGAGSLSPYVEWQIRTRGGTSPSVGNTGRLYMIEGNDGTYETGDFAAGDGAVSSEDLLRNCTLVGAVIADAASTTKDFVRRGLILVRSRYIRIAFWNALGVALSGTAGDHEVRQTPVPDESQ